MPPAAPACSTTRPPPSPVASSDPGRRSRARTLAAYPSWLSERRARLRSPPMSSEMGSFWDERADEDPFFFVDNRMGYRKTDLESFWADGERDLDALLSALGVASAPS